MHHLIGSFKSYTIFIGFPFQALYMKLGGGTRVEPYSTHPMYILLWKGSLSLSLSLSLSPSLPPSLYVSTVYDLILSLPPQKMWVSIPSSIHEAGWLWFAVLHLERGRISLVVVCLTTGQNP